jgi:putative ABC transport system permease protein
MTFRDLVETGLGNMWRMKLRTLLTLLGVVIAIGAFVAMLSFGAGMQEQISSQFEKLGLLFTIQVSQKSQENQSDTAKVSLLTDSVLNVISNLPGVRFAYPFEDYQIIAGFEDTVIKSTGQALSVQALKTKLYSNVSSGTIFDTDTAKSAIVTSEFLEELNIKEADSVLGKKLLLSIEVSTIDSALLKVFMDGGKPLWDRFKAIRFDSLFNGGYRRRILQQEIGAAAQRFVGGFMTSRTTVSDTLTIVGVLDVSMGMFRVRPVIFSTSVGQKFSSAGFSGDVTDLVSSLSSGGLFGSENTAGGKSYSRITIDLMQGYSHKPVVDTVRAMGFRVFSYVEEFEEMTRFFAFFDLGIGVIGLIALFVASLGIINTMMMSITERRREIGVLKSLGADEREIKIMFLVESALICTIGSVFGILLGWGISRIASFVARIYMEKQGVDPVEIFALPIWLILIALALGISVSLLAGYYPSARAARVDPVEALRYE